MITFLYFQYIENINLIKVLLENILMIIYVIFFHLYV